MFGRLWTGYSVVIVDEQTYENIEGESAEKFAELLWMEN